MGRTCLVFSGHPWHDLPYGLHHISIALARASWLVLFVESPFSPIHIAANRRRGRRWSRAPRPTTIEGLSLYAPFTLLPYLRSGPLECMWALNHWDRFTLPSVASVIGKSGFADPDLFLMGSPLALPLQPRIDAGLSIYRLADELSLLPSIGGALIEAERRALATSDVVVATSPRLEERAREFGARRVISVPNGVDLDHFTRPRPVPPEYSETPPPRIIYAGSLERWLDSQAILELARFRPGYSIVIIGPRGSADWLNDAPANVSWLGRRPYEDLPAYFQHANVGVIPFLDDSSEQFLSSVNPIKLHEYRAAGLPVVVPEGLGVDSSDPAILRYSTSKDFVSAVDRALSQRPFGDKSRHCGERSWATIVGNLLGELGYPDSALTKREASGGEPADPAAPLRRFGW